MLLSLGGDFTLAMETEDKDLEELFCTKYKAAKSVENPDFVIQSRDTIDIEQEAILNEIFTKPFCIGDGNEMAYLKGQKKLVIPFRDIGNHSPLRIQHEKGFPPDWIRFIFDQAFGFHVLKEGFCLLHAGAVAKGKTAILLPSWRFSGKTTTCLSTLLYGNEGVEYIADDGVLVSENGTAQVYSDAVHLDYSHLRQFPNINDPFSTWMKMRLYIEERLTSTSLLKGRIMEYLVQGASFLLCPGSKSYTKVHRALPGTVVSEEPRAIGKVFLLTMHNNTGRISSEKISAEDVVNRMVMGMLYERKEFRQLYYAYAYANATQNRFIEESQAIETRILRNALKNAECFELRIPVVPRKKLGETLREVASILMS